MAFGLGLLGAAFGRLGGHGGDLAITIGPPEIAWVGDESDARPDFDVTLYSGYGAPRDAVADDVLRLEYSNDGGSNWNPYLTHTLTSGEIAGDPITVSGVSSISNGDYLFRARLERGLVVSAWSDSEPVTVDVVALASGTPIGLLLALTRAGNPGEPIGLLLTLTKAS